MPEIQRKSTLTRDTRDVRKHSDVCYRSSGMPPEEHYSFKFLAVSRSLNAMMVSEWPLNSAYQPPVATTTMY